MKSIYSVYITLYFAVPDKKVLLYSYDNLFYDAKTMH